MALEADQGTGNDEVLRIRVGAVRVSAHAEPTVSILADEHEPGALRLALLRVRTERRADISTARLHRADETLQRWRYKVARWADMPPAAALDDVINAARGTLSLGPDTAALVTRLHRLEVEPHVSSGAKFATFAYLDRVLGLDLRHLVGKLRR